MAILITQARLAKDRLKGMIAAPEDASEAVSRLITQVGGKLIAYYLTSGDYDVLLIFEAPSYEDAVPALIVAAAENGVADLKTMMALTSSEMKEALVKAGSSATSNHPTAASFSCSSEPTRPTLIRNAKGRQTKLKLTSKRLVLSWMLAKKPSTK